MSHEGHPRARLRQQSPGGYHHHKAADDEEDVDARRAVGPHWRRRAMFYPHLPHVIAAPARGRALPPATLRRLLPSGLKRMDIAHPRIDSIPLDRYRYSIA